MRNDIFSLQTSRFFIFRFVNQSTINNANRKVTAYSLPQKEQKKHPIVNT